jgi:hypothetical protein
MQIHGIFAMVFVTHNQTFVVADETFHFLKLTRINNIHIIEFFKNPHFDNRCQVNQKIWLSSKSTNNCSCNAATSILKISSPSSPSSLAMNNSLPLFKILPAHHF